IGGGLTAVDTATEVQAYYLVQVEKVAFRYQALKIFYGEQYLRSQFSDNDLIILDEFLEHGNQVAAERLLAQQQNRTADLLGLIRKWGGVTIAYRRTMQESPAYRRNHEELIKALEQGIYYAEGLEPVAAILDQQGQVKALQCRWSIWDESGQWVQTDEQQAIPARTILVATGARLNVAYEFEHRGTFLRQDRFEYRRYELFHGHLRQVDTLGHVKTDHFGAFTSYIKDHRRVSFLGDTHPIFHGSVVKAIASAKRVYPEICQLLNGYIGHGDDQEYQAFRDKMTQLFGSKVVKLQRHNSAVMELVVRAPMAAKKAQGGQFYRLQNYEYPSKKLPATALQMEGLPLLSVSHVEDPELLSFFVVERGVSSRLAAKFKEGDPVALMGPTGAQSPSLLKPSRILVIGDLFAPAFLFSMKQKFIEEGHQVWYLGYFDQAEAVYCQNEIELIAEKIVWVSNQGQITCGRAQDSSFTNIDLVKALLKFEHLSQIDQVWVIGSYCLLEQTRQAQRSEPDRLWSKGISIMASVYGPMQCMLKGVCAQCLQWQINPTTGARSKAVYACSWQHQPLDSIDIVNIEQRLSQNHCQEILSNLWLDYIDANHS
ncbi:MAG: pyridine nucleotide-disulfide oxidoreductase, partial [Proteobacteria bacterium]|nr:pyridine nucleotide-disulfide oxidoreductase [Pseudomonadota bacterium]